MRKIFFLILSFLAFFSCTTIKVEDEMAKEYESKEAVVKREKEEKEKREEEKRKFEQEQKEKITREIIENPEKDHLAVREEQFDYYIDPVVIKSTQVVVVNDKDLKEKKKLTGKDAARQSMVESEVLLEDFVGGTSFYDYDENYQYPIFTKEFALTTIILNDDEVMPENSAPYLSDTTRWEFAGDVWETDRGTRQIIMIKPKRIGITSTMLVMTNKRLYHFILYSTNKEYQPMVKFRYPSEQKFITQNIKKVSPVTERNHFDELDMSKVSFNYKISVPILQKKVEWVPKRVYDDGSHTYILLPEVVLQKEFPAIWEGKDEITNYEHHPSIHNMIIVNKLVDKLTLRVGKQKVTIKKLKGTPRDFSVKR